MNGGMNIIVYLYIFVNYETDWSLMETKEYINNFFYFLKLLCYGNINDKDSVFDWEV